jgi:HAD superfamily phosphoserine phosphatase-like hydrolase
MKLALFDFDETLIHQNSLGYLFKRVTGKRFIFHRALSLAFKIDTYRHGIKKSIKRQLYKKCLAGVSEKEMYEAGRLSAGELNQLDYVVSRLYALHKQKYIIWIVTATPSLYVKGIIEQWGWPVDRIIGTELYQKNNIYTGDFGVECMQEEKVKRIYSVIDNEKLELTIELAFGNLPVDIPMMALANKSYSVDGKKIMIFKSN